MHHPIRTLLLVGLPFAMACGAQRDGASSTEPGGLRVALLTAGPVSDAGWNAGAYEGLLRIEETFGAAISHQQTRTPAEFDEAFLSYASSGYDLIFAHGFEYQDAAMRAGAQFPNTMIIVSGGGSSANNVVPLILQLEEGAYLAGMVAAGMSESGIVGMVGGVAIPPAVRTFRAFESGARAVDPDIDVLEAFTGTWDDVAAAKEAAVAQLARGADVLIHNVDAASFGVFQAVREAVAGGRVAWALGMNRDQNDVAPDVILGSAVIRIPEAFHDLVVAWKAGSVGGGPVYAGASQNVVDFVLNPDLAELVPTEIVEAVAEARTRIRAGQLDVRTTPAVQGEPGL